jgi:hypothetical protein
MHGATVKKNCLNDSELLINDKRMELGNVQKKLRNPDYVFDSHFIKYA